MKAKLLILVFLLSTTLISFAEESESVDWDKIEAALYVQVKIDHPDKSDAEIHQVVGYALLKTDNQWERAVSHFRKAVELDPKLYFSWYNLGLMDPDTEEGRNSFRKCIEAKSDFPPAYYWLGYSLCRNRHDEKALPVLEEYLKIAEDDPKEEGRYNFATKLVKELRVRKEGESLKMLRMPE